MAVSAPPERPTFNRRRAARFAAVQALYQLEMGDGEPTMVVDEFLEHRLSQLLEPLDLPSPTADPVWFKLVTAGAWKSREQLDPLIAASLAEDWSFERCGYLLRALLRAGAYEVVQRSDVPAKVAITEYVELARLFFAGNESGFVNAVLDRLARTHREAELKA